MDQTTRLAERLHAINPSSTLAITAKAKKLKSEGNDIVAFAAGEPDFDTPDFIKDAAVQAISSGFTKYTPTTGIPELKSLIRDKFKRENALSYDPEQIIVSCGAKHSIFNALMVLVGRGDEVIIPQPYWVSYPEMVRLCEGIPRFVPTRSVHDFKVTPEELKKSITPRTKVFILNSPSNPSGCVYTKKELEVLADVCVQNNCFVISDEIYEKLIYDGQKHFSIASFGGEIYNRTVTVNGLSKSFSMTGWRIGYLGAPADIAGAVSKLQDHSTSNPSSISQKAAVAALQADPAFFGTILAEFQKRRDYCMQRLDAIKTLEYVRPRGAFYLFFSVAKTGLKSPEFAARLLEGKYVSLIPGDAFGMDDYVRISFATSMEQLKKGMDRIEEFVKGL